MALELMMIGGTVMGAHILLYVIIIALSTWFNALERVLLVALTSTATLREHATIAVTL